jgi:hypothetical protein
VITNPGQEPVGAALGALPPAVPGMTGAAGQEPLPPALAARLAAIEQAQATEHEDGSVTLEVADPTLAASAPMAHGDNVALSLDPAALATIAQEVIEGVEADRESSADFFETLQAGLKLLGLKVERVSEPFDGASAAVHPLMLEAVVRFVANAHAELYPAAGPVKTLIAATGADRELEARAQRKARWLNYFLTTVDEGYYPDCDAGLLKLALFGSIFRKVYRDPISGQPRSRFLTPLDLLVSFHAPDLGAAQRVTQLEQVSPVELRRRMLTGYYRDVALGLGSQAETPGDVASRQEEGRVASDRVEDAERLHYHCHCWLEVPGFEHVDEQGQPTGLLLPWIATVDAESQQVLRLERDWQEGDPLFRRREHFSHWLFHPGLGFYGWGFIALLGATTDTASTLWRQAMDAFTLASFPGGFRTKSARPEQSNVRVGPMEFPEIDTGGLPIQQAIMPLPYKDVPASFAPILDSVVTAGQRLGQTVELQVGEGRQDAPVGTTLALIEQAIRPTAAVMKRLYAAQRKEFRLLAQLFAAADGATYPYVVEGKRGVAIAADFRDAADIVPVCDPNAPTQTQRLALAQGKLQLAQSAPGVMDVRAAYESMLRTMGCDDAEIGRLMPPPTQGQPSDVVTEFAMALKGMPLAAGPEQQHEAHLRAHIAQMQMPNLPPQIVQALLAHAGDHLAIWYRLEAMREVGMPLAPGQPLPPEVEALVAVRVADASEAILARIGPALAGAGGGDPADMAKLQLENRKLDFEIADSSRKAEETARQDATEVLKARLDAQQAAADREARLAERRLDLQREALRAAAAGARATEARRAGGLGARSGRGPDASS